MSNREEFEKWFSGNWPANANFETDETGIYKDGFVWHVWLGYKHARNVCQPEIDALSGQLDSALLMHDVMRKEIAGLKETVADLVAKLENLPDTSEFTLWWQRFLFEHGAWKFTSEQAARAAFNAKNPEIAALNMAGEATGLINKQLREQNAALTAENERLRKDEERYRWLCEQDDGSDIQILNIGKWVKPAMCIALTFQEGKEQIDAYIDAAMKEMK